ncbi:MAG: hypothetical protein COZ17_13605 [Flavobacteriaceae bacterium CG_4_10_14_3_um_filter_33_47]|nr:MAG: hypothetical protein COW44_00935 [Flavobacteriaceae bacterium CG17_big_fil_post_rev_8_21_14_2_50_33_15]PIY09311.1 MAG: hypothetical protein COZ17_13605 [Flavobacteriaceae bacterium CG_4_10_14_3_um_filter_33_47]PJB20285.1 MAG: hypothetical protein CO117_01665 [Flavobacteriaceae bacterium CG_4_9_14_3_um_filter_33_16]
MDILELIEVSNEAFKISALIHEIRVEMNIFIITTTENQIKIKQNESDKSSNSLLSKLIINLSKLLGAV